MNKKAKLYADEQDFAFFHVNFGTSKEDFNSFTELEKGFIRKEFENKTVFENNQLRDAVFNAYINANRKKGRKFQPLYKKKQEKADIEYNQNAIETINEIEKRDGKSWIDKIYQANGMKRKVR